MCSNLARKAAPHSFHVRIVAVPKIEAACCVTGVEVPSFARVVPAEVPSVCSVRRHHSDAALKNTSAPNNHAETATNLSLGLNGGGFVGLILTVVEAVTAVGTVAAANVVAAAVAGACVGTARVCCCCARSSSAAFMELSSSLKTASFGVELLLASSTTGDFWRAAPRAWYSSAFSFLRRSTSTDIVCMLACIARNYCINSFNSDWSIFRRLRRTG
ncbi:unnamed protein product [Closterium sp. NIES-54]